jgi:hypothetical protein
MEQFSRDELERAFQTYWRTGAVGENWDAWADLFTTDADYVEHVLGNMKGRETIRAWIKPIMEQYGELYTAYEWHIVDAASGRVVVYMQNRRDHPRGQGTIDFPGVTILQYAGNNQWSREEDYWAVPKAYATVEEYAAACTQCDPTHRDKRTRFDWGNGPAWTRGGKSYFDRPRPK